MLLIGRLRPPSAKKPERIDSWIGWNTALIEAEERASSAAVIDGVSVGRAVGVDEGSEKVGLASERYERGGGPGPLDEIVEIYVGREVLTAWTRIGFGTGEALMMIVGAKAALRLAVVEIGGAGSVVDGEKPSAFPMGQRFGEPLVVGFVNVNDLFVRPRLLKKCACGKFIRG